MEIFSNMNYKISFIVPLYNEEGTIKDCLDSIINISKDSDEIIVVDNGSLDGSVNIVSKYAKVLLIIRTGTTVAGVRNEGAKIATGNILAFVDADCVICDGWREAMLSSLSRPNVAATGSRVSLPEKTSWIERAWYSQRNNKEGVVNYINSGNLVVYKDVFEAVDGFDEQLITGEDSAFCLKLKCKGYLVYENPLVKVMHYGNPKSIGAFYKQQLWHGMGMLGTYRLSKLDKPIIMTSLFMITSLASIFILVFSGNELSNKLIQFFIINSIVPTLTASYRLLQYKNYNYCMPLVFLYAIYYVARSNAIIRIILSRGCLNRG